MEKISKNQNKIPKIIHYCWFGKGEKSILVKKCIESWKRKCPDYEIIEWNENNFNINLNKYVYEAYINKKWAFVSDYVRIYALYNNGGIYLDTDVEIIKRTDDFLDNNVFLGFESYDKISTGIIGAEKGNVFIKKILDSYNERHFVLENKKCDLTTNVELITKIAVEEGVVLNNTSQKVNGISIYPIETFSPKDNETGDINITKNTYTIHYFSGSWLPKIEVFFIKMQNKLSKIFNPKNAKKIVDIISLPYRVLKKIKNNGWRETMSLIKKKIKCCKKRG